MGCRTATWSRPAGSRRASTERCTSWRDSQGERRLSEWRSKWDTTRGRREPHNRCRSIGPRSPTTRTCSERHCRGSSRVTRSSWSMASANSALPPPAEVYGAAAFVAHTIPVAARSVVTTAHAHALSVATPFDEVGQVDRGRDPGRVRPGAAVMSRPRTGTSSPWPRRNHVEYPLPELPRQPGGIPVRCHGACSCHRRPGRAAGLAPRPSPRRPAAPVGARA